MGSAFSAALCRGLIEARPWDASSAICCWGFPRLYAAASLKRACSQGLVHHHPAFSAALCRGLIEASRGRDPRTTRSLRFPRLYAAASLKRRQSR